MQVIAEVLHQNPGRFAVELGIDLRSGPEARQRWFLAAILYGARISGQLAARTYQVFAAQGIYAPEAILAQGWDNLVVLLDEGGYARYDFKTATKLLKVMSRPSRTVSGLPGAAPRPLPQLCGPGKPPAGAGCGDRAHHGQYFPQGTQGHLGPGHAPPEPPGATGRGAPGAVSPRPHTGGGPGGPDSGMAGPTGAGLRPGRPGGGPGAPGLVFTASPET